MLLQHKQFPRRVFKPSFFRGYRQYRRKQYNLQENPNKWKIEQLTQSTTYCRYKNQTHKKESMVYKANELSKTKD